jgi:hypothetical protein
MRKIKLLPWLVGIVFSILFVPTVWGFVGGLRIHDAEATVGKNTEIEFAVTISAPPQGDINFTYITNDITAKAGKDYKKSSGKGVIVSGQRSAAIKIPLLKTSNLKQSPKTFSVSIDSSSSLVFAKQAIGTLICDENKKEASSKPSEGVHQ